MATVRAAPASALASKADIRAREAHARTIARTRERARQERATIRTRAKAESAKIELRSRRYVETRSEVKQARAGAVPSITPAKPLVVSSSIAAHRREVQQQQQAQARNKIRVADTAGGLGRASGAVVQSAKSSTSGGVSNSVSLVIFTIFGLIVFYLVATHPTQGWFGTLSNGLHALSSTTPLFTSTAQTKASTATTPTGNSTQGTQ